MKWSAHVDEPISKAKGFVPPAKWKLERINVEARWNPERLAFVTRADAAPLIGAHAQYSANVVCIHSPIGHSQWQSAPMLFTTLKAAQQWCELEVRLREVGELA